MDCGEPIPSLLLLKLFKNMKYFKKILLSGIVMFYSLLLNAQFENKGIVWTDKLNWQQVKEKAKKENKYIFLDIYTTWCAPCKLMEKQTYISDTIGQFFNDKFISVKVQMDKTSKDDEWIKNWYSAADSIASEYRIRSYPTYVFLSPLGKPVHKDHGFKQVKEFLEVGKIAVAPGKQFNNEYAEYDELMSQFEQGNFNFNKMSYMFKTAVESGQFEEARQIRNVYIDYLKTLTDNKLLTKEIIEFLAHPQNLWSSKEKFFGLFYKRYREVDELMNKSGYGQSVADRIVFREEVASRIEFKRGKMNMIVLDPSKIPPPPPEPDWHPITKKIKTKYNSKYAERITLDAKILWYRSNQMYQHHAKHYFLRVVKYGDAFERDPDYLQVNHHSFQAFLKVNDRAVLQNALKCMEVVVQKILMNKDPNKRYHYANCIDTYACLFYKLGEKDNALKWEIEALNVAKEINNNANQIRIFEQKIKNMKLGDVIWSPDGVLEWDEFGRLVPRRKK